VPRSPRRNSAVQAALPVIERHLGATIRWSVSLAAQRAWRPLAGRPGQPVLRRAIATRQRGIVNIRGSSACASSMR
jgi:hypothetical protein